MEINNEDEFLGFNIFESYGGKSGPYLSKHQLIPLVRIGPRLAAISECAQKDIGLTTNHKATFAEKEGTFYFAVLPMETKIKGYRVFKQINSKTLYMVSKTLIDRGVVCGLYKIDTNDIVHKGGIDWFPLEKFIEP